jgi:hypothetical protein
VLDYTDIIRGNYEILVKIILNRQGKSDAGNTGTTEEGERKEIESIIKPQLEISGKGDT